MKYGLMVITHGEGLTLDETLSSFRRWVTPQPDFQCAVEDGQVRPWWAPGEWTVRERATQGGFCSAAAAAWEWSRRITSGGDVDFMFWLENDFRFLRPVDVKHMATALRWRTGLAQMALMRQPVNRDEVKAGGVIEARPDATWERWPGWIEHTEFWTTNPSLIPARTFLHAWPDGPGCEGKFGIGLREAGLRFGYWGDGSVYVEHIGSRDGKGY